MADYDQKQDIPCACGDDAHKNLEVWYQGYLNSSIEEKRLLEDKLNKEALEAKIHGIQVPVSNGYCPNCQKLLDGWPEIISKVPEHVPNEAPKPYQQPHFNNVLELDAGYRSGCMLCTLFVQCSINRGYSLENWHRKENRLNCLGKSTLILISVQSAKGYFKLTLTWPGLDNYCWLPADPLYCIKNYDMHLFNLGEEASRLTARGSLSQLEIAKKWLDLCLETHESCKSTEDYRIPNRLIDVSSATIRLVQTSDLSTRPRYATLSHCWGTQDFYKLHQNNLDEFKNAIPEEKLTQTFQDAIRITRSLGLNFLWIDSLCIIQRSNMDWRSESALMSSVYGGSTISIAATGATDGTKGCFLKPPSFIGKVRVEPSTDEVWDMAPSKFYHSVAKSPLASRAWALQERLLSPRVLHFSATELFWECQHCDASESFPEGSPDFEHQHMFHRDKKPISEIWHTIVRLYTSGKLSFASDKMVAISGIAQKGFEESKDEYLAGLWRKDVELQLLWCQQSPGKRPMPGSEYRAPSWSWASVDENGFVHYAPRYEKLEYVYHAHFESANIVLAGKNPFGELEGGELQMSYSLMLSGQLKKIQGEEWNGRTHSFYEIEIDSLGNGKESFRVWPDSDEHDGRNVYLLPVLETLGKGKHDARDVKGLIIVPTSNKKGEYSRAGSFSLSAFDERNRLLQDLFLGLLETSGKTTAKAQCAEILKEPKFVEEKYLITII